MGTLQPIAVLAQVMPPVGIIVNSNTNAIQLINPATRQLSGALLGGQLGGAGIQVFDVVITPDGKTAIISSFEAKRVFFIDVSGGFSVVPTILGSTQVGVFPIDLAVTANGKFVLATGSGIDTQVSVVDVSTRTLVSNVAVPGGKAQAVAVSPDGRTVFVADYDGKVHIFSFDPATGALTFVSTIRLNEPATWPAGVQLPTPWNGTVLPFSPVNVAVSPEGKSAIVVDGQHNQAAVVSRRPDGTYALTQFVAPASVTRSDEMAGAKVEGQSAVFSRDGRKAYYATTTQGRGTKVNVIAVTNGVVTTGQGERSVTPTRGSGPLFGVDTIALDPIEHALFVANPTVSGGTWSISVPDLATDTETILPAAGIPTGIAFNTVDDGNAAIHVSSSTLSFVGVAGGANPPSTFVTIENTGMGSLNWTSTLDAPWASRLPVSGTSPSTVATSVNTAGLSPGTYSGRLTISGSAVNSPQVVTVNLTVLPPTSSPPVWTDPEIRPGETSVKAVHVKELREAVDNRRQQLGLPPFDWGDDDLIFGELVILNHLNGMRTALREAFATAGKPEPTFTDSWVVPGQTTIKAAHIIELRTYVMMLY